MKKQFALSMAVLMAATSFAGCGASGSSVAASSAATENTTTEQAAANPDMPYEGVTLHYATTDTAATGAEMLDVVAMVKEKTGINIEFTIIPNPKEGEVDKKLVSLQAGDELDLVYGTTAQLKTYYNAGVLEPVDQLAADAGYDMAAVFGENLPIYDDGKTYGLPAFNDIWVTFYNKNVFDAAGVAYPTADGWTWDKYVETAKQLTDIDNNVYGSLMLDYDVYNYMLAIQKGATHYKEDGTANYDDPRFKESLEFYYGLGNTEKIQPDSTTYAAGVFPWNSFVTTGVADENGKYGAAQFGMFVCGGWVASMLPNAEKYPRDWECGIAPMPYPEGEEPSTFAVTGCYAIPTTSKNKAAAFEALRCIAENQYTLGYGRVPARKDLTDEEVLKYVEDTMVPTYADTDKITAEMLKDAWFDSNRTILSEKVVGPADVTISQIWTSEGPLYGQGQQDIDKTIENIQNRSNEAIKEESAS
ncbi:MAG: extracellular solute-binding protein [Gemmiger sp.]|nr:extracellular solute-binding protein [Gemmiger sp.]